ncbi:MAG: hypothetical protein Q8L86_14610 [Vicinamibacterales bacterium]|nr:hypothetical protein [Vicinamibacterales bacterium]
MNAESDRERTLDLALKQAFGAESDPQGHDGCLDAETLAAWTDGGLDEAGVALAEAHVSNCARCQALVGAMSRTMPVAPVTAGGRMSAWRWWLAPLAVGAAAATIWVVVPDDQYVAPPVASVSEVAQASPEDVVGRDEPEARFSAPPPAAMPRGPVADEAPKAAAAEVQAPAAPEAAEDTAAAALAGRSRAQTAEAPMTMAAPAPSMARPQAAVVAPEIVSPDPAIRWRIGVGGVVDHSADGGGSWERLSLGEGVVTGGVAPAPAVCWLVGRGGLVLVTVDGRAFARTIPPVAVDLAGVEASDALNAIVTTVDGRRFRTDDGGRSWRQAP